ncbi:MAG: glutaredoxin family protein [Chloroflexia bacterium]
MEEPGIVFYGTTWCGMSRRRRQLLDQYRIPYRWVDIDRDEEAARFVERVNNGFRSVPTIVFPDGRILVEPSEDELRRALGLAQ